MAAVYGTRTVRFSGWSRDGGHRYSTQRIRSLSFSDGLDLAREYHCGHFGGDDKTSKRGKERVVGGGLLPSLLRAGNDWCEVVSAIYRITSTIFYFGSLAMVIGVQLFLAGFLGELISRNSTDRNNYQLAEKTGY